MLIFALIALAAAATFYVLFMKFRQEAIELRGEIQDLSARLKSMGTRLEQALKHTVPEAESRQAWARFEEESRKLERELGDKRAQVQAELSKLNRELGSAQAQMELIDIGFRRRDFTYEDPRSYQDAIRAVEDEQAAMLRSGQAAKCTINWTIDGSEKKAEAMMKKLTKLALRAFNADADAAIAKVKWNNFTAMEDRIRKCEDTIEKTLDKWGIVIDDRYRNLKLKELRLTFEQAEVEQKARDEQRALREQLREEEKARREAERARVEAEQQERKLQQALAKAKQEMEAAHTSDMSKHLLRIKELETQLNQVSEDKLRAVSMAQLTKMGHVYIISNLGSFGDDVVKIGMTRRLDPMDRVWELSDASVPFDFDVHALIKCDDAPALEAKLHQKFAHRRLNLVNDRKEFFRVSIQELQTVVQREGFDVQLTLLAEAKDYRESEVLRRAEAAPPIAAQFR